MSSIFMKVEYNWIFKERLKLCCSKHFVQEYGIGFFFSTMINQNRFEKELSVIKTMSERCLVWSNFLRINFDDQTSTKVYLNTQIVQPRYLEHPKSSTTVH